MKEESKKEEPVLSLEEQLALKKQEDLKKYIEGVTELGKKYNCGLTASVVFDEKGHRFTITAINLT